MVDYKKFDFIIDSDDDEENITQIISKKIEKKDNDIDLNDPNDSNNKILTDKIGISLRTATTFFKEKKLDKSMIAYEETINSIKEYLDLPINDKTNPESLKSSNNLGMIYRVNLIEAISKSGLSLCYIISKRYDDAIILLNESSPFLDTHVNNSVNNLIKYLENQNCDYYENEREEWLNLVFNEIKKRILLLMQELQHLLTSIDSLIDVNATLMMWENSKININRGLNCCDIIIDLLTKINTKMEGFICQEDSENYKVKEISKENLEILSLLNSQSLIIKKRKACFYLTKGHIVKKEFEILKKEISSNQIKKSNNNEEIFNLINNNSDLTELRESFCFYWEESAKLFSITQEYSRSYMIYKDIALQWVERSGIKAYVFDKEIDKDIADKTYDAWKKASKESSRNLSFIKKLNFSNTNSTSISNEAQILLDIMLTHYEAGISMITIDNVACQRSLETSEAAQANYSRFIKNNNIKMNKDEEDSYKVACGDLAYHLGFCYLRVGKVKDAINESLASVSYFKEGINNINDNNDINSKVDETNMVRQKHAWGLVAMAYAAAGETEKGEKAMQQVRKRCLGPLEDADKEVIKLTGILSKRKDYDIKTTYPVENINKSIIHIEKKENINNKNNVHNNDNSIDESIIVTFIYWLNNDSYDLLLSIISFLLFRGFIGSGKDIDKIERRKNIDFLEVLCYTILVVFFSILISFFVNFYK